jgi:type I restriction enzyme S subunit
METAVQNTTKRYDKYKPSGVEWLGDIPEHWEVKRFKHISNIQKGKLPQKIVSENLTNLAPYMSMEYLRGGEENQWVFDKNAKIINDNETLLLWDGSNAGEFIKSRKGVISSTVAQIDFYNIDKGFAWYYSKFLEIELRKKTIGMGIPHVNGTELKNFSVVIPSHKEQTSIVEFLDDKTTKIDQAIAIKQQQIDLLKERRQILIHKAVTQGINPNVKLKDSGVEWIGEIPEHWEFEPIKHSLDGIIDCEHKTAPFVDEEDFFVIRTSNVKEGKLTFENAKYTHEKGFFEWTKRGIPKPGDILLTREAPAGEACIVPDKVKLCLGQRMVWLKINRERLIPQMAIYFIYSKLGRTYIDFLSSGSTVLHFNMSDIKNIPILAIPINEQKAIVEYIENASDKIATAIAIKEQEIEKLKEYKSSLIDGVVTGKVRVC